MMMIWRDGDDDNDDDGSYGVLMMMTKMLIVTIKAWLQDRSNHLKSTELQLVDCTHTLLLFTIQL